MITGFNHSGFVVKDIEKMVAFYRDSLGLSVMREVDSVAPPEGDHTGIPGAHRHSGSAQDAGVRGQAGGRARA